MKYADVIIIGSGIAALQLAHHIRKDKNVIILTKSSLKASNSSLAQGGIAASIGKNDHYYYHCQDTMEAGRYSNNEEVVLKVTEEAPHLIADLRNAGCEFDEDSAGQLSLGMEGAHSQNRIVHSGGDATGKHLIDFLADSLTSNITIIENIFIYELMINELGKCIGAKGKNQNGSIQYYFSEHVVIASGGCGYLYSLSSNSPNVTGDGIAMAYLAGAEIADMEFIQFHPTMLVKNGEVKGLISEAVRGQGAKLVTKRGKAIMEDVHPLKDLGPRHIVSQTIFDYVQNGDEIFLDISMINNFKEMFPSITEICIKNGINLDEGMIPVLPGSHFLMGGIKVNLKGMTNIPGLYAIGEAACTGLHGANRLASNSLLEGLSFGKRLAELINFYEPNLMEPIRIHDHQKTMKILTEFPNIDELRRRMMENVGIVRNEASLTEQKRWLESFVCLDQKFSAFDDLTEYKIQSILASVSALLITTSALARTESRGGHFRTDYPIEDNEFWQYKHLIYQFGKGRFEIDEQIKAKSNAGTVFS